MLVGVLGNLVLAVFKISFGLWTYNRLALMDGLYSLMASAACMLPWQAEALLKKRSDDRHPYGLGKILFLSMAAVGAMGLVIGIHMFLYSFTIRGWLQAHPSRILALMVTAISIFANRALYRYLMDKARGSANTMITTAARYNRTGVWISCFIFLLEALPLLGFTAVEGGGVAIVSIIVFIVALKALHNGFAGIMDKAPSQKVVDAIAACADSMTGVKDVLNVNARYVGVLLHIDMSIAVDESLTMREAHEIAQSLKKKLLTRTGPTAEVNVIIA